MPVNLTRIGEVFRRADNGAIWMVEGLWWRGGILVKIEVVEVENGKVCR